MSQKSFTVCPEDDPSCFGLSVSIQRYIILKQCTIPYLKRVPFSSFYALDENTVFFKLAQVL